LRCSFICTGVSLVVLLAVEAVDVVFLVVDVVVDVIAR
jgi:hypothetical protein